MSIDSEVARQEAKRGRGRPRKEKPLGRLDRDGQEAVIADEALTDAIVKGKALLRASNEASEAFSKFVNDTAKKSGYLAAVVRRVFVDACDEERFAEGQRKAKQAALAYEAAAQQTDLFDGAEA